jgi:hypothetical protein
MTGALAMSDGGESLTSPPNTSTSPISGNVMSVAWAAPLRV